MSAIILRPQARVEPTGPCTPRWTIPLTPGLSRAGRLTVMRAMTTYRIAVIAGDGIGKEVIPAGIGVLSRRRRAAAA